MNNQEADDLIAEIKTAAQNECFGGGDLTYAQVVEKVINLFANRPPKDGIQNYIKYKNYVLTLKYVADCPGLSFLHITPREFVDNGHDESGDVCKVELKLHELKQLRDSINLMLEYMERTIPST